MLGGKGVDLSGQTLEGIEGVKVLSGSLPLIAARCSIKKSSLGSEWPHHSSVTLNKLLNLSVLQFLIFKIELLTIIRVGWEGKCSAHSRPWVSTGYHPPGTWRTENIQVLQAHCGLLCV